jgi:hypothetical protein
VFVNWESPHVSPVDLTPDGSRLLAVNTADNRLEVFWVLADGLSPMGSVQPADVTELIALAEAGAAGLVVKGIVNGGQRGWYLSAPGTYQSDRAKETVDEQALLDLAGPDSALTLTLVVAGSEHRLGVDRDGDGFFDGDELDAGSDPADPDSTPDTVLVGDIDGDGVVGVNDFLELLAAWGPCPDPCPPGERGACGRPARAGHSRGRRSACGRAA